MRDGKRHRLQDALGKARAWLSAHRGNQPVELGSLTIVARQQLRQLWLFLNATWGLAVKSQQRYLDTSSFCLWGETPGTTISNQWLQR
ncbi:MAG: hypothetical protein HKP41_22650 [Desulfobacterales bacterium]|nr:hypothetical protein [Desulfobacterales bacterium]